MTKKSLFALSNLHDLTIDCNTLSDESTEAIAKYIADRTEFGIVESLSPEGQRLADALEKYAIWEAPFNILLVDGVLTDGNTMIEARATQPKEVHPADVIGWVIFASTEPPAWVNAVFRLED